MGTGNSQDFKKCTLLLTVLKIYLIAELVFQEKNITKFVKETTKINKDDVNCSS
jgi:PII-like signaling protein